MKEKNSICFIIVHFGETILVFDTINNNSHININSTRYTTQIRVIEREKISSCFIIFFSSGIRYEYVLILIVLILILVVPGTRHKYK